MTAAYWIGLSPTRVRGCLRLPDAMSSILEHAAYLLDAPAFWGAVFHHRKGCGEMSGQAATSAHHSVAPIPTTASNRTFCCCAALSMAGTRHLQPAEQKALQEAAGTVVPLQWKIMAATEADSLAKLKEWGCNLIRYCPRRDGAAPSNCCGDRNASKRVGDELIDSILAAGKSGASAGSNHR
jgi:hypothetical protein